MLQVVLQLHYRFRLRQVRQSGDVDALFAPAYLESSAIQLQAGRQGVTSRCPGLAQLLHQIKRGNRCGENAATQLACAFQNKTDKVLKVVFNRQIQLQQGNGFQGFIAVLGAGSP